LPATRGASLRHGAMRTALNTRRRALQQTILGQAYSRNGDIHKTSVPSATIKIFLVHGDPKRLRTAELSNWTGKAVAGPRSEFDGVIAREEAESSGIYLLSGSDRDSGRPAIYIGEAECIRDRLRAHLQKDFWNQVAFL